MCMEADEAMERGGGGYVERNEKREKIQLWEIQHRYSEREGGRWRYSAREDATERDTDTHTKWIYQNAKNDTNANDQ